MGNRLSKIRNRSKYTTSSDPPLKPSKPSISSTSFTSSPSTTVSRHPQPATSSASPLLITALKARSELDALITTLQSPTKNFSPSSEDPLLNTLDTLSRLLQPPRDFLISLAWGAQDLAAFNTLCAFDAWRHIPYSPSSSSTAAEWISTDQLSSRIGLDAVVLSRMLGMVRTYGIVEKSESDDKWRGTLYSNELVHNMDDFFFGNSGVFAHIMGHMHQKFLTERDENTALLTGVQGGETVVPKAKGKAVFEFVESKPLWKWLQSNPKYGSRFGKQLECCTDFDATTSALSSFITSTNRTSGVFIDVGGGSGHIALRLAPLFPHINFIVQDLYPIQFPTLHSPAPQNLTFTRHDFFAPQPVPDSSSPPVICFYIRWCLHNYEDEKVVEILRTFMPVLEKDRSVKVVIEEMVTESDGGWGERRERRMDLQMLAVVGGRERGEKDWESVVGKADGRLRVEGVRRLERGGGGFGSGALVIVGIQEEEKEGNSN